MARVQKIWVISYKLRPPQTIGYHSGEVSIGVHKDRTVEEVMNMAGVRIKGILAKRDIIVEDDSILELKLDVSYTM
jgi:hypothetical protein